MEILLKKYNLPLQYVFVTELQSNRWKNNQNVVPHIHLVFIGRKHSFEKWAISTQEIDEMWRKSLKSVIKFDLPITSACKTESVKHSIANYLANYLKKGTEIIAEIKEKRPDLKLPTFQPRIAKELRNLIESDTHEISNEIAELLDENFELLRQHGVISGKRIFITLPDSDSPTGSKTFCAGVTAYFRKEYANIAKHLLKNAKMLSQLIEILESDQLLSTA